MTDTHHETLVRKSALALADIGWRKADTHALAEATGYPERSLIGAFGTKYGLIGAVNRLLTAQSIAAHRPAKGETVRDRLFDILMERFEVARDLRPFFKEIKRVAPLDPAIPPAVMLSLQCNMWATLKAAGVRFRTPFSMVKVKGLTLLYLPVSNTFLSDDSEDLPKTMAALDKALERAERIMKSLKSGPAAAVKKAVRKARSSAGKAGEKGTEKSGLERRPAAKTGATGKKAAPAKKKKKPPAKHKATKKKASAKAAKKKSPAKKSAAKKRSGKG